MPPMNKAAEIIVQVSCLVCRHKSILSNQALASFDIKPDAPVATFVKRQGWKAPALTTPGPSFFRHWLTNRRPFPFLAFDPQARSAWDSLASAAAIG